MSAVAAEADIGVDIPTLTAWMDDQGLGDGPIEGLESLGGGTQNILLRFSRAGRSYIFRRPPLHPRANSNETMRREARVLAALANTPVPHPRLIAACTDESVLGVVFYLMEPITGFNPIVAFPPLHAASAEIRHRMGLSLIEGIAMLGEVDYKAVGLEGFGKPDNFLGRQVARWQSQLDSYSAYPKWPGPDPALGVGEIADWLAANQPAAFTPGILHGDYHIGNVLFEMDGPGLAAIVDWELATIGDPLLDLGWVLANWPEQSDGEDTNDAIVVDIETWADFATPAELVAHYRARSTRDLSAILWYAVLACYKLGIILEGTYARSLEGQAGQAIGDRHHRKSKALFRRARHWLKTAPDWA